MTQTHTSTPLTNQIADLEFKVMFMQNDLLELDNDAHPTIDNGTLMEHLVMLERYETQLRTLKRQQTALYPEAVCYDVYCD